MSNPPEQLPAHLLPITVEIPVTWTPEQALAVFELLDNLRERIWDLYKVRLQDLLREQQQSAGLHNSGAQSPPLIQRRSDRPPSVVEATPANRCPTNNPVVRSRRPSRRPDLHSLSSPRTAAVKHGRRPPAKPARSVLDGREHGGILTAVGRQTAQRPRRLYAGPHRR